jgi:glycosyltransferase involved in cell wall biosynthesis
LRRFAIAGTRGIPANYGGFETFAEELSTRLARRGHEVTVYCRQKPDQSSYRGVRLVYLPTIRHKYLDTVAHTFLSSLHLLFHRQDAVLFCNAANAVFTWIPRAAGIGVALNVDGVERKRKKWNRLARFWYLISERLATIFPNAVITDASAIQRYYRDRYGRESTMIPYGAEVGPVPTRDALGGLGLVPRQYFLYVSRMEPENNALAVREAFERVPGQCKLVLVGDAPYAQDYIARVRATSDPRVIIPGAIYGQGYRELGSQCLAYIHATEVGGTHPALIENMGRGALTLYLENAENAEVAGGAGLPFHIDNLTDRLSQVLAMPDEEKEGWRRRAMDRVRERYDWEAVTSAYEVLLESLVKK